MSSRWSLDEALYEVTSIRSDLSNLLQPRPRKTLPSTPHKGRERPNTPTPPPPKRIRTTPFTPPKDPKNPKEKGKGGKQGKGLGNKAKAEDWPSNWVYKAHEKVLCKRYQRNLCTVPRKVRVASRGKASATKPCPKTGLLTGSTRPMGKSSASVTSETFAQCLIANLPTSAPFEGAERNIVPSTTTARHRD